jgi:multidrug transporter EmrE-like cation transporter
MTPSHLFLAFVLAAVILETAGDILFKLAHTEERNILLVFGVMLYFVAIVVWALSLRYELLSKAISVFSVLNLIAVILAGLIIFGEEPSLLSKIGIVLGIVAVALMQF